MDAQKTIAWSVNSANGWYTVIENPRDMLAPGIYEMAMDGSGKKLFIPVSFPSDQAASLPGLPSDYIFEQIETFWKNGATYQKHGFLQKRGILLYGPPGCGKTCIIRILCDRLIQNDGVIFVVRNFEQAATHIASFRQTEPSRPVMTLMEDVEGLFEGLAGPSQVQAALSFLDGQAQINNVVHVATTNKPEELADRFIKRPGRFDLVIGIHAPKKETREAYLRYVTKDTIPEPQLQELVAKTEGLGLSYLRELASTFLCLGIPLDETLARLQSNFKARSLMVKKENKVGFTIGYEPEEK